MELQKLLSQELKELNQVIISHYQNTNIKLIQQVAENLIESGGKRIRPILTLALCKIFNYNSYHSISAAAAIELIHSATLLHDDVVDEANMRRGKDTAKKIWGNKTSILVGDFLFSVAFQCAISCKNQLILQIISDATSVIAEGEMKQLLHTNNLRLTHKEYLEIISAKTAKLFEAACSIASALSSADGTLLAEFGHSLGMAFQITDDAIDYQPGSGKDIGKDFYSGKVTLPLIIAYQQATPNEKFFWEKCISEQKENTLDEAIHYLHKHNALAKSLEVAESYLKRCYSIITNFPPCETTTALYLLIKSIVSRSK